MSEPKRYTDLQVWEALHFAGSTNGWIRWAEYARLKAEVERLRKAGDAMADFFVPDIDDLGHNYGFKKSVESVISNWRAAKEGKPTE